MRKQYWTIIDPKGHLWMNSFWKSADNTWDFLHWLEDIDVSKLKKMGYRVVKIWVEVEE